MAITGTLREHGELVGFSSGRRVVDLEVAITAGIEWDQTETLSSVAATPITLQAGATLCYIVPPVGNTTAWYYATNGAGPFLAAALATPLRLTTDGVSGGVVYLKTLAGTVTVAVLQA